MAVIIEASVLAADYTRLGEQAREAEAAGVDALQVDIMDGQFVPNLTFGPGIVEALHGTVALPLDAHLMIVEPERFVGAFAEAGAARIIVHQEATSQLYRVLEQIRERGVEAGVCLNPGTPAETLDEVLELVNVVQVMTVNPGWGGQAFLASQLGKIRRLRAALAERGLGAAIAVDGGVDARTVGAVVEAGAMVLVAGSSVFGGGRTVAENVAVLRRAAGE